MKQTLNPTMKVAFSLQAKSCKEFGSPFMADLCDYFAHCDFPEGPVKKMLDQWRGDPTYTGDSVPLRLCGSLHRLVLDGQCPALSVLYPPKSKHFDAIKFAPVFDLVLQEHSETILQLLGSAPQTNEVRRSSIIYAGLCTIGHLANQTSMALYELGASAGFNLLCDRYCYEFAGFEYGNNDSQLKLSPQWQGERPPATQFEVIDRRGCDLNPLDATSRDDFMSLRSYTWPDQLARLQRLDLLADISAKIPVMIDCADAGDWLRTALTNRKPNCTSVIYHTIAYQYFPKTVQNDIISMMKRAGERCDETNPLAWLSVEGDGDKNGAAVLLHLWPHNRSYRLGRADFHGRWVTWNNIKEEALQL